MFELHTVHFPGDGNTAVNFARLRDVFAQSVRERMPGVPLRVHEMTPCDVVRGRLYGMSSNTHKLAKWVEIAERATTDIVLCDCDLMAVGSIADAWERPFDVGYTRRAGQFPFNSGVVFVRNTDAAKAIMRKWLEINDRMFFDPSFHERYRRRYAGMNQSAWGYMLETNDIPGTVACLPAKYNCCSAEWLHEPDPRIYHIKDQLRRACLNPRYGKRLRELEHIVGEFHRIERALLNRAI